MTLVTTRVILGDCRDVMPTLPEVSFQCCVTSPPYFGLRDYGMSRQIGLEASVAAYVAEMVKVFSLVRRTLSDDGTLWLNLGDSYVDGGRGTDSGSTLQGSRDNQRESRKVRTRETAITGLRPKNLIGIPWRVAFALQADGWYLRSDIVWHKPNPMPESVTDRPTRAHEFVFLFSKSPKYYYDADAIRTPMRESSIARLSQDVEAQTGSLRAHAGKKTNGTTKALCRNTDKQSGHSRRHAGFNAHWDSLSRDEQRAKGANARDVWTVATQPFKGAHFATFPPKLVEPCILAGSKAGDTVIDPFGGAGTTGLIANRHGRNALLVELNPEYAIMARERIRDDAPLFTVPPAGDRSLPLLDEVGV